MKRAVLLHGTDGSPDDHWFPWLRRELEVADYEVFSPSLPNNHTPNREVYDQFLRSSGWDFSDNIIVGHSSGATTVLNLLSAEWFPRVKAAVLVGTFLNEKLMINTNWHTPGQFDNLFLGQYQPEVLKSKADKFIFVHGDNDPTCDIEDARELCGRLDGEFVVVPNGQHLSNSSGFKDLPGLMEKLEHVL